MTEFHLIAAVLGSVLVGVLCTLLVQWGVALRALSREATRLSQQVAELTGELIPVARRVGRWSHMLEDSEPDLRALQDSIHLLADGSTELAGSVMRARRWVSAVAPVVIASVEHLAKQRAAGGVESHPGPSSPAAPRGPVNGGRAGPVGDAGVTTGAEL